jgi:hypothetical protein
MTHNQGKKTGNAENALTQPRGILANASPHPQAKNLAKHFSSKSPKHHLFITMAFAYCVTCLEIVAFTTLAIVIQQHAAKAV